MTSAETIRIPSHVEGRNIQGCFARPPRGVAPKGGILVIHEISGLDHNACQRVSRFADEGYVAFAPDLFAAAGRFCVVAASTAGGRDRAVYRYLRDARDHLAGIEDVGDRIGVAGFCMGGRFAVMMAGEPAAVRAAAPFYGMVPRRTAKHLGDPCPVFGRWGGKDWVFRWSGIRLERFLAGDEDSDVRVIPAVGHGYMNRGVGEKRPPGHGPPLFLRYDEEHAEASWRSMVAFFDRFVAA